MMIYCSLTRAPLNAAKISHSLHTILYTWNLSLGYCFLTCYSIQKDEYFIYIYMFTSCISNYFLAKNCQECKHKTVHVYDKSMSGLWCSQEHILRMGTACLVKQRLYEPRDYESLVDDIICQQTFVQTRHKPYYLTWPTVLPAITMICSLKVETQNWIIEKVGSTCQIKPDNNCARKLIFKIFYSQCKCSQWRVCQ